MRIRRNGNRPNCRPERGEGILSVVIGILIGSSPGLSRATLHHRSLLRYAWLMSLARFVQRHRVVGFRNYKRNFVLVNLGKECAKTRSDELPFRMDLARRGIWIEVVQLLPALSRIRILSVIVLLAVTLTSCVA